MKKIIIILCVLVITILAFSVAKYSFIYMYRIGFYLESDTEDWKIFPERGIQRSSNPYFYEKDTKKDIGGFNIEYTYKDEPYKKKLNDLLIESETTSFIVVHNDAIIFENYYNGHTRDSINTSFSSIKSVVSLLVGIAIDEGYIKSEKESIVEYIPEFRGSELEDITIEDLLRMRSKISYQENMLWFGDDAKTYYMPDLRNLAITKTEVDRNYGGNFHYNNYHPLLLGIILERSTGKSVSKFLEEVLWKKIGAEYDASWSLDSDKSGFEKMESGFNFRSIDFIKIGSMLLHDGKFNGESIISKNWLEKSLLVAFPLNHYEYKNSFLEDKNVGYQYMWYSLKNTINYDYFAVGKYGQFLYISPSNNVIIMRNGITGGNIDFWPYILRDLANAVNS